MTPTMAPTRKKNFGARQNVAFIYIYIYVCHGIQGIQVELYNNTASKHLSAFPFLLPPIMYHSYENIIL
jgi:hypothetical protein